MNLADFFDYKNKLMEDILTTPSIVSLLSDDVGDSAEGLAYKQVFPYEYIPDTVQEGKTFICFEVDVEKTVNKTFYLPIIYIWVFTHKSKLRLSTGGIRTDMLSSEIAKKINGSLWYGLGELELMSARRFAPMSDFQGKCLKFEAREFNRQHDPKKSIPSNRKVGV